MDESEILVTTAQVTIGLAGFTGVASVLSQRSGSTSAMLQAVRLRTMIELSLLAAGFALLPLALDRYEVLQGRSWRLASGLYLLAFASQFSFASRRIGFRTACGE